MIKRMNFELGVVVHTCDQSREVEARISGVEASLGKINHVSKKRLKNI